MNLLKPLRFPQRALGPRAKPLESQTRKKYKQYIKEYNKIKTQYEHKYQNLDVCITGMGHFITKEIHLQRATIKKKTKKKQKGFYKYKRFSVSVL